MRPTSLKLIIPLLILQVLPTSVRSVLSGSVGIVGRIGGVAAPFLFVLARSAGMPQLPFWVMGGAALAATALCLALPETCGSPQPDSLNDFELLAGRGNFMTRLIDRRGRYAVTKVRRLDGGPWAGSPTHSPPGSREGECVGILSRIDGQNDGLTNVDSGLHREGCPGGAPAAPGEEVRSQQMTSSTGENFSGHFRLNGGEEFGVGYESRGDSEVNVREDLPLLALEKRTSL